MKRFHFQEATNKAYHVISAAAAVVNLVPVDSPRIPAGASGVVPGVPLQSDGSPIIRAGGQHVGCHGLSVLGVAHRQDGAVDTQTSAAAAHTNAVPHVSIVVSVGRSVGGAIMVRQSEEDHVVFHPEASALWPALGGLAVSLAVAVGGKVLVVVAVCLILRRGLFPACSSLQEDTDRKCQAKHCQSNKELQLTAE